MLDYYIAEMGIDNIHTRTTFTEYGITPQIAHRREPSFRKALSDFG